MKIDTRTIDIKESPQASKTRQLASPGIYPLPDSEGDRLAQISFHQNDKPLSTKELELLVSIHGHL